MSNRVAFVTGGAQGIGQGISETLGASGFRVAVADLNLEAAEATAKRIAKAGGEAIAVHVDVTDTESVRGAVKTVTAELGEIEILVNNAGWDDFMPFLKTSEEFWDKILDINFKGALRVIHAVVPSMVEHGFGRVINIGSDAGRVGSSLESVYSGAKGGIIACAAQVRRQFRRGRRQGDRRDDPRGTDEAVGAAVGHRRRSRLLRVRCRRVHHRSDAVGQRWPHDGLSQSPSTQRRNLWRNKNNAVHP
jgi:NAD(P)-dependent dehydrogenase (short-subunit alcohol dehydrogenase family)